MTRSRFKLLVLTFSVVTVSCFVVAQIVLRDARFIWMGMNEQPGPWKQCAFKFDNGDHVILMRRSLPGMTAEYGLRIRVELFNGMSQTIPAYTESQRTDIYSGIGITRTGQRLPLLRLETAGSTYRIDMTTLEELHYPEVEEEGDGTSLGYFDGVEEFIPSVPYVSMVTDSCGVLSTQP